MAFVLNKIISATYQPLIMDDRPVQDLLFEASALISRLGTSEIPISERAKEILTEARALIGKAIFNSAEAVKLRSSSLTSTGSLGDRLAVRDKEDYLYTYPWVSRDSGVEKGQPNAIWARGNNFRSWATPTPTATITTVRIKLLGSCVNSFVLVPCRNQRRH
jgi:hypothetical protein